MSTLDTTVECPKCGAERRAVFDNKTSEYDLHFCDDALCEDADSDNLDVQIERLRRAVKADDLTSGDSFWLGVWEFLVI